ncbi:hypothetical protein [Histidinibacterium aquaticum]|uniref:hypothetical protein n=1 Tax=Histidinibacterium aquaticum TaxID=2613962 RepID=UPI00168BC2D0|nr:hypothetical protein [Histidinibacterium aquaticum]
MIGTLVATLTIFALAVGGLALGGLKGRPALRGSCGGVSCEACETCPKRRTQ